MTGNKPMERKSRARHIVEVITKEILLTKKVSGRCHRPWQAGFIKAGRSMRA